MSGKSITLLRKMLICWIRLKFISTYIYDLIKKNLMKENMMINKSS